jgi:23S rRNA (adenine2503-C2)-methyltransferase
MHCDLGLSAPLKVSESVDGTKKYLFRTLQGEYIESALIPDGERMTLCVSSQAGCKMGCKFCATGRMGFRHHLTSTEIINQIISIPERDKLTNLVFMGMGEPLDNIEAVLRTIEILTAPWGFGWSPKRITLSSIGVTKLATPVILNDYVDGNNNPYKCVNPLEAFLDLTKCHLAISLHNPVNGERLELMPMQKAFPIEETLRVIKRYDFTGQRRVSFEYTMFAGVNDSKKHADAIVRLLKGLECRINLIRFHAIPDSPLMPSAMPVIEAFRDRLNASGITTTIRASRGEDIFAACGMLAGKK